MAYRPPKLTPERVVPVEITMQDFSAGQVTLIDEARLSEKAALDATNLMQSQDGLWTKRWGTANYGAAISTSFDGWGVAVKDDGDGTTTQILIVVDGGVFKKSTDGGSWSTIAGGVSFTAGLRSRTAQIGSRLYFGNGTDPLAYYDIINDQMVDYSGIVAPTNAATNLTSSGLSTGSYNNYYKVTAVNLVGETTPLTFSVQTTNKKRDNWATDGSDFVNLTWTASASATGYNIYWSDTQGYEVYIGSTSGTAFTDDGTGLNELIEYPDDNTTTGPKMSYLAVSSSRLWGTLDPENPWRIYFTGTGNQLGAFSRYFGGGWVDVELGGAERPVALKHFRDGKGTPTTIVFTKDPQGGGSTWICELVSATVGSTPILIPALYKITGSNGTPAPDSVIEARNSLYGYSRTIGFTSLGTKSSMLNVLATDEVSVNIRPSARGLNGAAIEGVTGVYYDGKAIWSVPEGSTTNNKTFVLDFENKNWAVGWGIGFDGFIEYTDSNGNSHLLGVPTDNSLYFKEISENYLGDSGESFNTKYTSGLIHFDRTHTSFAHVEDVTFILGRPKGNITLTVGGTKRNKSFANIKTKTITAEGSNSGVSYEPLSYTQLSTSSGVPEYFQQAAVKKTIRINKLLNNIKLQVSSTDLDVEYTILRIIIRGVLIPVSPPSDWRN
jgi:hypothetical protein